MSTVAPPTDTQIKQALRDVIRTQLISLYGSGIGSNIVIWDHWPLTFHLGESGSSITVYQGIEEGIIHSWAIGLNGISRKRPNTPINDMGTARLKTVGPNRRDQTKTYRVWCIHQLDIGTSGNESNDNSENEMATEIDAVADAISLSPTLGLDNPWMQGHEEIQFSPIDTFSFGENMVSIAQGNITILLQRPLILT